MYALFTMQHDAPLNKNFKRSLYKKTIKAAPHRTALVEMNVVTYIVYSKTQ